MTTTINNFEIPSWAGKPPTGLHLDVMKDTKMVQKLMIDEKKCYFFGRNKQMCDFCTDHASCSRCHAVLLWHKHLNRPFIVDLGSTHGTFIGSIILEGKKPQQVPIDSELRFGASTRKYVIRERPQNMKPMMGGDDDKTGEEMEGGLLGLPETESELDNLTEFNTAHNRRITAMSDIADVQSNPLKRRRQSHNVHFNEEEQIINPEDIDPSIGRFRNMIHTTVIPRKKPRTDEGIKMNEHTDHLTQRLHDFHYHQNNQLYTDIMDHTSAGFSSPTSSSYSMAAKLGVRMPNLAPDVDQAPPMLPTVNPTPALTFAEDAPSPLEPKKKKYAKEAWPGKKPLHTLLV